MEGFSIQVFILYTSDAIKANAIKTIFSDCASSSALAFSLTKGIALLTLNLTKPDPVFVHGFMSLSASEEMPIRVELRAFFDVHDQQSYPGGVHLEITGQNASQSLELAFNIAERLWKKRLN
ncbi:hypothetical protein Fmac_028931 [Flemingia macrophylla]|uniref:Uncharacterized protein n=1 Tax=Flemingia macrophylla TaxID=520843 RepID=A0ABD1L8W2_9FABA